ncbi:hypothetical protein SLE2022_029680 [Rubroshorea leprosula]
MGEHGGWAQTPSGLLPNGLLPNEEAAWVSRLLNPGRLQKAEEITAELIARIQPNPLSEKRRNDVVDYLRRLIKKCFSCEIEIFTYGSVPLKTYLPDGDIDLAAFSKNQNLKETWACKVRDMLLNEKKNENAEFRVTDVMYIPATVKIIKCVVENIVVDISFNQLDGLVTLCFLEEVDHLINQNHLFKRSIILIKAWCYYESHILGASHGLISTFALETLVLYIFHVFNNSFAGPLEVLYRFLEFYSKFDWDNFCVSLWGPVPKSSLPDVTAKPPLKDGGELLLSKLFLDAWCSHYGVFPGGQENQGQPSVSKKFNVIDPSCMNSNLGRSVSEGNFFRIRSAFALGAERLARLLDCPKENLFDEVNQFFLNVWKRHRSGHRPDAPRNELWCLRFLNPDNQHGSENVMNNSSGKRNDVSSGHGSQADVMHGSHNGPLEYGKGKSLSEHSSQKDDDSRDWNLPSTMGTEMAERNTGAQPVSLHVPRHQLPGLEPAQTSGSDSLIPTAPMPLAPGSRPFTCYPAGPSVTFVTKLFPTGTGTVDASTSHFSTDEGLDDGDSGQNFDLLEVFDHSEVLSTTDSSRVASVEPSEHEPDIRNSDFASHWQNLQYGRSYQNSQHPAPLVHSSPFGVPPVYLQGRFPWDGPSVSNRPTSFYQRYVDDMPRYRSGVGTFLPNPSQNGPVRLNSTQSGSANVAYGGHLVATLNPSGVSSNGPHIPSVVMPYPYDHTTGEGGQSGGVFVEQRFHGGSGQRSSPDQPSSPHLQR